MSQPGNALAEPVSLSGVALGSHPHVCAFFRDQDEEYRVLIPFIVEGIRRGEKVFHTINPRSLATHLERLQAAGIHVRQAQQSGQLEVRTWEEFQLREGHFDQGRLLSSISGVLDQARSQGYPRTRFVADMDWVFEDRFGLQSFLSLEIVVNQMLLDHPDPVI
jgi:hypothetical protein